MKRIVLILSLVLWTVARARGQDQSELGLTRDASWMASFDAGGMVELLSGTVAGKSNSVSVTQSSGGSGYLFCNNSASTTNYLAFADSSALAFSSNVNFTIMFWLKITDNSANSRILDKRNGGFGASATGGAGWHVFYLASSHAIRAFIESAALTFCTVTGSTEVADSNFHHITVVFNRNPTCTTNGIVIFVDGTRDNATVAGGGVALTNNVTSTQAVAVGTQINLTQSLRGSVDDIRFYPRAVPQSEIQDFIRQGKAIEK